MDRPNSVGVSCNEYNNGAYAFVCTKFQKVDSKPTLAHWGNTEITGRGLLALAGQGSIFKVRLEDEETYIVHPR